MSATTERLSPLAVALASRLVGHCNVTHYAHRQMVPSTVGYVAELLDEVLAPVRAQLAAADTIVSLIQPRIDDNRRERHGGQGMTAFDRNRMEALAAAVDAYRTAAQTT